MSIVTVKAELARLLIHQQKDNSTQSSVFDGVDVGRNGSLLILASVLRSELSGKTLTHRAPENLRGWLQKTNH